MQDMGPCYFSRPCLEVKNLPPVEQLIAKFLEGRLAENETITHFGPNVEIWVNLLNRIIFMIQVNRLPYSKFIASR